MYEDGPNPTKVQITPAYKRANPPPPLVLIHDGGGTTFGYFMLGNLYREVWAIHNPHFFDGGAFEGGMDEMARLYIQYMKDTGIKGNILLGGWSLGGFLSLAVSRFLAEDPEATIKVLGIVMMDTPHHLPWSQVDGPTDDPVIENIPPAIQKCFERCDEMIEHWEVPKWDGPACDGKTVFFGVGGRRYSVPPGKVLHKSFEGAWSPVEVPQYSKPAEEASQSEKASITPPPTVLIRAIQHMPLPEGRTEPYIIDKHRNDRTLGWSANAPEFIKAVIDVNSNHYEMFDKTNNAQIKDMTTQLNLALEILDSIGNSVSPSFGGKPKLDYF
ncbi:alpha/beta-hydrolase [Trichoderma citrinoviride]|uniref:Alpha/beta-hydrolase n=1 Tax=Trichoderma citrinoviride TaxID=58853 RepID=A0A2T4AZR8_9HYPO|nr:alpha/beta-hydrolase [Trichoderma citrinoviride]PTB62565.1 alpha/beta-hydrolase [Trichoderma citrinoviride]